MCCDGTLFHSVTLQPNDSARTLASLGLILKRKKGIVTFRQPCLAHQHNQCAIYSNRPQRCRVFQCQQIRRVASGQLTEFQSRQVIQTTRKLIEEIKRMIEEVTETNPSHGLAQRYAVAIANAPSSPLTSGLTEAMETLKEILEREFRVPDIID
ncbi:MAG: hypothetical protein EBZ78_02825 [Verrucomicrobia bacterium]|nr:hypothetical protein [Verrucomicrobiota bacterium]